MRGEADDGPYLSAGWEFADRDHAAVLPRHRAPLDLAGLSATRDLPI